MHGGYGGLYCDGGPDVTLSVLLGIFFASLRAVLCVAVLAAAGLWLSRAGVLTPRLSKGLSSLSVKLAIPALLFSSIVSSDAGISVELLSATWPLLLLPALYLVLGALVGCITLWLVDPPRTFRLGTVAACCFGNTTGIPIVLLSVLQQSLSRAVFVELADPLMFLAIELLSVPLLQYVAGSLLLRHAGVGSEGELRTAEAAAQPPRAFSPGAEEMLSKTPKARARALAGGLGVSPRAAASNTHISMMSVGEDEQFMPSTASSSFKSDVWTAGTLA
jgi:hypothetical protein